ncbi:hypothetical protein [Alkalicoccus saliphilus]|uniref:Transglutaminase-like domain-containing protein n=1 Tax=Alkalicoccus saliphilus TaxID=200989 RepID=A0A2T4U6V5_9BACI|nr:hypothetical protein [Alkalicoccus saliphilus]PTL39121.1 hypothetical protein C6Y45_08050 [Alkalicoccus saliphilus]
MNIEDLPNFKINHTGRISREFLRLGINEFTQAVHFIGNLPYGRNSRRREYELVLTEKRGTCSTKHALLAHLCMEQKVEDIKLYTGIYEMDDNNTPGVGRILQKHGLKAVPEAHCYLKYKDRRYDFTSLDENGEPINTFLKEEQITPPQIGSYKVNFHRSYIRVWLNENKLNQTFSAGTLWEIREECINELSQER